ncbi:hypothetical protein MIR68_001558 [Amoeboaphelidium protococcarum]|nr:hypothetical protein MIR68_001558 [Amoeboaphelidium protococcarum]
MDQLESYYPDFVKKFKFLSASFKATKSILQDRIINVLDAIAKDIESKEGAEKLWSNSGHRQIQIQLGLAAQTMKVPPPGAAKQSAQNLYQGESPNSCKQKSWKIIMMQKGKPKIFLSQTFASSLPKKIAPTTDGLNQPTASAMIDPQEYHRQQLVQDEQVSANIQMKTWTLAVKATGS